MDRAERRRLVDERHADRVRIVSQLLGRRFWSLVIDPDRFSLSCDQLGQFAAELHFPFGIFGNDQLWLELPVVAGPEKAYDRGFRSFTQQFEGDANDFVRFGAADQLDAELVERQKV